MKRKKGLKGYVIAIFLIFVITIIILFTTGNINLGTKNKITEENYMCPEGYILVDEKCKKDVFECPTGTVLLSTGQCSKTTITYTCPEEYELYNGTKCVNSNTADYVYVCPEGYNLYQKTKCKKGNEIISAIKILKEEVVYKYTCPTGYVLYNNTKCRSEDKIIEATKVIDSSTEYNYICPEGYELYNKTKCKNGQDIKDAKQEHQLDKNYSYVCPEGYELYSGTKCKKGDKIIEAVKKENSQNSNITNAKENIKQEEIEKEKITQTVKPIEKNKNFTVNSIRLVSGRNSYTMSHDLNNEYNNITIKLLPENVTSTVTCESSNDEVINLLKNKYTINNKGIISILGIGPGIATITCKTENGKTDSFTLTICPDSHYINGVCNG